MKLDRFWSLFDHWREVPTVRSMLAAFFGVGQNDEKTAQSLSAAFGQQVSRENLPAHIKGYLAAVDSDPKVQELMQRMGMMGDA